MKQDKGKGKGKPAVAVWPTVLELLMEPQAVAEEQVLLMFAALGCKESTTKELFEVLSAKDIAEALQPQDILDTSSIIESMICAKTFRLAGVVPLQSHSSELDPEGETLAPPPQVRPLYPQQPPRPKRKVELEPQKPKRKSLEYEGHLGPRRTGQ